MTKHFSVCNMPNVSNPFPVTLTDASPQTGYYGVKRLNPCSTMAYDIKRNKEIEEGHSCSSFCQFLYSSFLSSFPFPLL